ncbi:hypothetical protein ACOSP7_013214 [Xanthoceras sorbifolium]
MYVTEKIKERHLKLYRAAVKGDWVIAEGIIKNNVDDIRAKISQVGNTVLHIAAAASHTRFVQELVQKYITPEDLMMKNEERNTAFVLAAASGNMELVKFMMNMNKELSVIRCKEGRLPVQIAALFGHEKIVRHLYKSTENELTDGDRTELLVTLIDNSLYDTALQLLQQHGELATFRDENGETALHALARKPLTLSDLVNPNQQGILKRFFKQC